MLRHLLYTPSLFIVFLTMNISAWCQDSSAHKHKHKITWQMLELYMDDDFFNFAGKGTDQYYTGGWQADLFYTRNTPPHFADRILLKAGRAADNIYSYGIFRRLFTPTDISVPEILQGDRPYAALATIQHRLISTNKSTKEQIISEWGVGVIGPWAMGKEYQTLFHKLIGSGLPMGWDNQVRNDFILDYRLSYEKEIIQPSDHLKLFLVADGEAGTLVDNTGLGFEIRIGIFNNQANCIMSVCNDKSGPSKKMQLYWYMKPIVRAVMFNATLEGGFFSHLDPYVIYVGDMNDVYLQYDNGLVFSYGRLGVEFIQKLRTPEFKGGLNERVGNITLYYAL